MKRLILTLMLTISPIVSPIRADSPAPAYPYAVSAPFGRFYFKMIPLPPEKESEEYQQAKGTGIGYKILDDGSSEEIWRFNGLYSFEVFLSYDGNYLVAMGPWSLGSEPKTSDVAVVFYAKGKLLKRYSTADLVKDKTKVSASVSHYTWLARDSIGRRINLKKEPEDGPWLGTDNGFRLKTCDGIEYIFDVTTGEIVKPKP